MAAASSDDAPLAPLDERAAALLRDDPAADRDALGIEAETDGERLDLGLKAYCIRGADAAEVTQGQGRVGRRGPGPLSYLPSLRSA
jgi:hypothetical protein